MQILQLCVDTTEIPKSHSLRNDHASNEYKPA